MKNFPILHVAWRNKYDKKTEKNIAVQAFQTQTTTFFDSKPRI